MIHQLFPNGMPLSQQVMYESLPRFCKQCRVLGHTISTCTKSSGHKRKNHSQTVPSHSGCFSPSTEIVVVEKQSYSEEAQGERGINPMSAKAAVAVEGRTAVTGRKRAKLAATRLKPTGVNPSASLKVVQVSDDPTVSQLSRLLEGNI